MKVITHASPPKGMRKQRSFVALIEALKVNDGWVAVCNEDVTGTTKAQKQTAIHAACQRAGHRVETRTTATQIFIRTLKPSEAPYVQ